MIVYRIVSKKIFLTLQPLGFINHLRIHLLPIGCLDQSLLKFFEIPNLHYKVKKTKFFNKTILKYLPMFYIGVNSYCIA